MFLGQEPWILLIFVILLIIADVGRACVVSASQPAEVRARYLLAPNDLTNAIITPASASPLPLVQYTTTHLFSTTLMALASRSVIKQVLSQETSEVRHGLAFPVVILNEIRHWYF
jgi:hypothetical protein